MGDVARRRRLVDLLDLRALVGGLLRGRAAAHATHVGHTCGEKTQSSNRSQR